MGLAQRVPLKESLTHTRVSQDPPGMGMGEGDSGGALRIVGKIGRAGTQGVWSFAGLGPSPLQVDLTAFIGYLGPWGER